MRIYPTIARRRICSFNVSNGLPWTVQTIQIELLMLNLAAPWSNAEWCESVWDRGISTHTVWALVAHQVLIGR